MIELLASETIEKNYKNYFLKLSFFLHFLFVGSESLQKQTRKRCSEKRLLIKILQKSKGKKDLQFSEKFTTAVFERKYEHEVIKTLNKKQSL